MRTPQDSHRVAALAYQFWEQEGRPNGRDLHHWDQAQKQLEVEFRVGFPDATGAEDLASNPSPDSGRVVAELDHLMPGADITRR